MGVNGASFGRITPSGWYLKRLMEDSSYRPTSGYRETQEYHASTYPGKDYYEFAEEFGQNVTPKTFNKWMKMAKNNGVSYVILTAKHHDGFCLWKGPTNYLQMFKDSALKYGLKFGIYYSWSSLWSYPLHWRGYEFDSACTKGFTDDVICAEMAELATYKPDIFWFDGHWACKTKYCINKVNEICKGLIKDHPGILINDRIPGDDLSYLGPSGYRVFADRYIPKENPNVPWEHINTIGLSWGYNKQQGASDYKSGEDLFRIYSKVRDLGGRLLLNFGPDKDGILDPNEVRAFEEFGSLLYKH